MARQAAANITYTEVRYDPIRAARSGLARTSISPERAVLAIEQGLQAASQKHGVRVYQLLCAMRGQPASACFELVELASEVRSAQLGGVVGVDLAGDEFHFNNSQGEVESCFRHAKLDLGLNTTVHAGEMAGPDDVRTAVEVMLADRIGHGYSATSDASLMSLLNRKRVHLEACPGNHPKNLPDVRAFLDEGLSFGLNTDDPAEYFGNSSLPQNELIVEARLNFTTGDVAQAYANARAASFATHAEMHAKRARVVRKNN